MLSRRELIIASASHALCGGSTNIIPKRIALVIGNADYSHAVPLPNAVEDAKIILARLTALGFEAIPSSINLDRSSLMAIVSQFGNKLKSMGPNVIAFFYYSGHAAQDDFGVNYLIPIDVDPATPNVVRMNGVPIAPLLRDMEESNNNVNVVVLDACRDWFKLDRKPKDPKGLHDMGLNSSVFIAYATRCGSTADEAPGLHSSPYSRRLIEALNTEASLPIALVFDDIQTNVYSDTDALQLPIYVNGLVRAGRWALSSGALSLVPDTPRPPFEKTIPPDFLKKLDRTKLLAFTRDNTSFVDVLLNRRDLLAQYELNNPNRLAFFLASIAFETGGFKQQTEKFGYSPEKLRLLFSSRITSDEIARNLSGKPEAIANFIYGGRLGNGPPESGDGWRYRGRSFFFITGKASYARYGKIVNVDLVDAPELANDLETGLAIAAAVWRDLKVNVAADKGDMSEAVRRFRGTSNTGGMTERLIWLRQAQRALDIEL